MKIKQTFKSALSNFYPTNLILDLLENRMNFHNEKLLIQGKSKPKSTHQSILFFTTHKCASVYVNGTILTSLTKNIGMIPIDLMTYLQAEFGKQLKEVSNSEAEEILSVEFFQSKGYFYGPLRYYPDWEIKALEDYKIMLMLRDPRDVLTSLYFSIAYSHSIPKPKNLAQRMLENRNTAIAKPIDAWVLETAPGYLKRYKYYCENLLGRPNVFFVKYEDMVNDFPTWLDTVIKSLELNNVDKRLVEKLINEADFDVEENINSHKRQVKPGDHRRKPKPQTINQLNSIFSEVLDLLDYVKVPA